MQYVGIQNEVQLERVDMMHKWFHENGFKFGMTGSEIRILFDGRVEDMPLACASAGIVMGAMEEKPDYWVNGWCMEDGMRRIIEQMPKAAGVIKALCGVPELIPEICLPKVVMRDEMPEELAKMTWSCREPQGSVSDYRECGKCEPCTILGVGHA